MDILSQEERTLVASVTTPENNDAKNKLVIGNFVDLECPECGGEIVQWRNGWFGCYHCGAGFPFENGLKSDDVQGDK